MKILSPIISIIKSSKSSSLLAVFLWLPLISLATHNRAGEITFQRVGAPEDYEYEITCTTYTDSRSVAAHRSEIEIFFGYGPPNNEVSEIVPCVTNECKVTVAAFTWRNMYRTRHKFPGPGTCYIISFTDPNRVSSIININDSFSVNIPFYIETQLCIFDDLGITSNNSPVLLEMPVSFACLHQRYIHNPNAYDKDGDSISYSLVVPKMGKDRPVTNYTSPEKVAGNTGGTFTLDPVTGDLVWDSPKRPGLYNIAFKVTEWRRVITPSGSSFMRQIGYVTRDMQIIVTNCNNKPPQIANIDDICVKAGGNAMVEIKVKATDPDAASIIHLTASGGPFEVAGQTATFVEQYGNPVEGVFKWQIDCSHIRKQPYSVVFNATDNGNGFANMALTDLEQVNINVIGPEPENLATDAIGNGIKLTWDPPKCGGVINYFIYRKSNESGWTPGDCETGVPKSLGFTRVAIVKGDVTEFYDNRNGNGLFHGVSYCYRVTALYKLDGQFEQSEGVASNESCAELHRDVPIITKASVLVTKTNNKDGEVEINWASPIELDTTQYKPYYRFVLKQSPDLDGNNYSTLIDRKFNNFKQLKTDTLYISKPLNTDVTPYSYQIDFFHFNEVTQQEELIGSAKSASTPWLKIKPAYQSLQLIVETDVPWKNDSFVFYRKSRKTGNWDYLGSSNTNTYKDSNLINGVEYCYRAETYGNFRDTNIISGVFNQSQEDCEKPKDTVPPCPPVLSATADCDMFQNYLSWTWPTQECAFDVVKYRIFFQNQGLGKYVLIDSLEGGPQILSATDNRIDLKTNLSGCYKMVVIDSFNNLSDTSNIVCVDNCPIYRIPNVFTPTGDNMNDTLVPFPDYRFVKSVEITILNRWGQEVYTTNDIHINWDGKNERNGKDLNPGTYYYVCDIEYYMLKENKKETLTGSIQLIR
ncbi:T9SS type B sorting domain-containing protein [bacterium]|nr:T9SS type B sorting domain-containing protein [bacterium]